MPSQEVKLDISAIKEEAVASQRVPLEETSESAAQKSTSPITSPPSSPPVASRQMSSGEEKMAPPSKPASNGRKRSRGQSESASTESSATARGNIAPPATQGKDDEMNINSSATVIKASQPDAAATNKDPASANAANTQSVLAPSDKSKAKRKSKSDQPAPPQSAQRDQGESNAQGDFDMDDMDLGEPHEAIDDFDWRDLEMRYHEKLREISEKEAAAHQDFNTLINYFEIWSAVGSHKEVDRSYKRLKTQMTFVQHEEDELEKKRLHYIKVVEAFKTVGVLLNSPNWAKDIVANPKRLGEIGERVMTPRRRSSKRRRSPLDAIIDTSEWGARMVGDIDMQQYLCHEPHRSRCAIL